MHRDRSITPCLCFISSRELFFVSLRDSLSRILSIRFFFFNYRFASWIQWKLNAALYLKMTLTFVRKYEARVGHDSLDARPRLVQSWMPRLEPILATIVKKRKRKTLLWTTVSDEIFARASSLFFGRFVRHRATFYSRMLIFSNVSLSVSQDWTSIRDLPRLSLQEQFTQSIVKDLEPLRYICSFNEYFILNWFSMFTKLH